jgi:hypothetical protein
VFILEREEGLALRTSDSAQPFTRQAIRPSLLGAHADRPTGDRPRAARDGAGPAPGRVGRASEISLD